jgi:hypothetical protein
VLAFRDLDPVEHRRQRRVGRVQLERGVHSLAGLVEPQLARGPLSVSKGFVDPIGFLLLLYLLPDLKLKIADFGVPGVASRQLFQDQRRRFVIAR